MTETRILQFKKPEDVNSRLEPATCTEAETFVLQVLDESMEPEFKRHCMIVIDPTGHATDGSYVLATPPELASEQSSGSTTSEPTSIDNSDVLESFVFRQLRRSPDGTWSLHALNPGFESVPTANDLSDIVGVIVQRAGTRRRYHKRYD